jgi:hypothetical protein
MTVVMEVNAFTEQFGTPTAHGVIVENMMVANGGNIMFVLHYRLVQL